MTELRDIRLIGVAEPFRPTVDLGGNKTFWDILNTVNFALKAKGLYAQAEEFRWLAYYECPQDEVGEIIMLALAYVKLPEQEL